MVFNNHDQTRGYAPRGKELVSRVPHGHWQPTTFVGDNTKSGIVAPMLLDGLINSDSFKVYIEQVLAPEIRSGDLVIIDNLSSHKRIQVRQAQYEKGMRVKYLHPYRSNLDSIGNAFSKFEAIARSSALRSISDLWYSITRLIHKFRPAECANDFIGPADMATQMFEVSSRDQLHGLFRFRDNSPHRDSSFQNGPRFQVRCWRQQRQLVVRSLRVPMICRLRKWLSRLAMPRETRRSKRHINATCRKMAISATGRQVILFVAK